MATTVSGSYVNFGGGQLDQKAQTQYLKQQNTDILTHLQAFLAWQKTDAHDRKVLASSINSIEQQYVIPAKKAYLQTVHHAYSIYGTQGLKNFNKFVDATSHIDHIEIQQKLNEQIAIARAKVQFGGIAAKIMIKEIKNVFSQEIKIDNKYLDKIDAIYSKGLELITNILNSSLKTAKELLYRSYVGATQMGIHALNLFNTQQLAAYKIVNQADMAATQAKNLALTKYELQVSANAKMIPSAENIAANIRVNQLTQTASHLDTLIWPSNDVQLANIRANQLIHAMAVQPNLGSNSGSIDTIGMSPRNQQMLQINIAPPHLSH
ncbi:MAG: hypothetical protein ACYCSZ_01935 [Burkholderiales bacterium]